MKQPIRDAAPISVEGAFLLLHPVPPSLLIHYRKPYLCLPDIREQISAKLTEAICEFLAVVHVVPPLPSIHVLNYCNLNRCLPDTREQISAKVTEAICEFLGLKMADIQYPIPVQAN